MEWTSGRLHESVSRTRERAAGSAAPYVEVESGTATYVEHHRTLGDRVRELTAAGLRLVDLVEPEWPASNDQTWGGWSPLRGALIPGTAIFVCEKP